jgi:hypothetical protein
MTLTSCQPYNPHPNPDPTSNPYPTPTPHILHREEAQAELVAMGFVKPPSAPLAVRAFKTRAGPDAPQELTLTLTFTLALT